MDQRTYFDMGYQLVSHNTNMLQEDTDDRDRATTFILILPLYYNNSTLNIKALAWHKDQCILVKCSSIALRTSS